MEFDVEKRKQQLASFEHFVNATSSQFNEILTTLGWTKEYLDNGEAEMVSCPINPEHRMPEESLKGHVEMCKWRTEGYHHMDLPLPDNSSMNFGLSKSTIVLDSSSQASILKKAREENEFLITGNMDTRSVPKTSDRLTSDFTKDERRVLYDHVIAHTHPPGDVTVADVTMIGDTKQNDTPRPKSKLEMLIEERDAKRRRISYRKKVHTNRKTQTEILREVIQNQMELLVQIIKGECDEEKDDKTLSGEDEDHQLNLHPKSDPSTEENTAFVSERNRKNNVDFKKRPDWEHQNQKGESSKSYVPYTRKYNQDRESNNTRHTSSRSRSKERRDWSGKRDRHYEDYRSYGENKNRSDRYHPKERESYKYKDDYRQDIRRQDKYHYHKSSSEKLRIYPDDQFYYKSAGYCSSDYDSNEETQSPSRENSKYSKYHKHSYVKNYNSSYYESKIYGESKNNSLSEFSSKKSSGKGEGNQTEHTDSNHDARKHDSNRHSGKSKHKKSHKHKSKSKSKKRKRSSSSSPSTKHNENYSVSS